MLGRGVDPRIEIIAWLVFLLAVTGFLSWLALVVWRNDQKPIRQVRREAVEEQAENSSPAKHS